MVLFFPTCKDNASHAQNITKNGIFHFFDMMQRLSNYYLSQRRKDAKL